MNSYNKNQVIQGLQEILNSTLEGSGQRNSLYDLTLLHKETVNAQVAFKKLIKNPKDFYLYSAYSQCVVGYNTTLYWMYSFATSELSSKSIKRLKKLEEVMDAIRKISKPIIEDNKDDILLSSKIISLFNFMESELLSIWLETTNEWDISNQMDSFTQESSTDYVKHLINYRSGKSKFDKEDLQLNVVNHFKDLYYQTAA